MLSAILVGALLVAMPGVCAEKCAELKVSPRFILYAQDVTVQIRLRRHVHHRYWRLAWDSDVGSAGSSGPMALNGADAPAIWTIRYPEQPPGNYVFVLDIYDASGSIIVHERAEIHNAITEPR